MDCLAVCVWTFGDWRLSNRSKLIGNAATKSTVYPGIHICLAVVLSDFAEP